MVVYILSMTILFLADYIGKEFAYKNFTFGRRRKFFDGKFQLCYVENRGIAFNMLDNRKLLIIVANIVLMTYIAYLFIINSDLRVALLLIFTGGLGNLFDRFKRGYVIDYIYFNIKKWPVFNLSDFYVFFGVILALI